MSKKERYDYEDSMISKSYIFYTESFNISTLIISFTFRIQALCQMKKMKPKDSQILIQYGEDQDQGRWNPGLDISLKEENGILDMKIGLINPDLDFSMKEENGILEIKMA